MNSCHNCIHERDPVFVFGSAIRTLTVGSLIFIVAFAWSEFSRISFECYHNQKDKKQDEMFNKCLKYAITTTLIALIISFLAMFYIPGTKW